MKMTVNEMRRWLLDARPYWRRETIMAWHDSQVIAIYYKEVKKGPQKRETKRPALKQLSLF